jgi:hypothetical protein
MKRIRGDIWRLWDKGFHVVVTTNIGWDHRDMNNMGAGTVQRAASVWPELPRWYGSWCRSMGAKMGVVRRPGLRLVFLPVKPLIEACPSLSWDQKADLVLIERGLVQLGVWWRRYRPALAMTLPGAGNGGLDPAEVLALVERVLGDTEIVLCDLQLAE